jgi:hypothetical protein
MKIPLRNRVRPVRPDAAQARAIADLEKIGYSRDEVCAALRISPRTYYRRRTEIDLTPRPVADP